MMQKLEQFKVNITLTAGWTRKLIKIDGVAKIGREMSIFASERDEI